MKRKQATHHTSIDTLSIAAYDRMIRADVTTTDYLSEMVLGDADVSADMLAAAWGHIQEQYLGVVSQRVPMKIKNDLLSRAFSCKINFEAIQHLLKLCKISPDAASIVIPKLAELGYKIDESKPLPTELDRMRKQSLGLVTKYNELLFEINQQSKGQAQKKDYTLTDVALSIEMYYGNGMRIDTETTPCRKWLAIEDRYLADINALKKNAKTE